MSDELLTVPAAAARLGLTPAAMRKRIERGQIPAHKGRAGRWMVRAADLEAAVASVADDATTRQDATGQDTTATRHDTTGAIDAMAPSGDTAVLISHLQGEVAFLRGQLERAHEQLAEERRRADTVLAMLSQRPQELAPPVSAVEQPTTSIPIRETTPMHENTLMEAHPPIMVPIPTNKDRRRPWWRLW